MEVEIAQSIALLDLPANASQQPQHDTETNNTMTNKQLIHSQSQFKDCVIVDDLNDEQLKELLKRETNEQLLLFKTVNSVCQDLQEAFFSITQNTLQRIHRIEHHINSHCLRVEQQLQQLSQCMRATHLQWTKYQQLKHQHSQSAST